MEQERCNKAKRIADCLVDVMGDMGVQARTSSRWNHSIYHLMVTRGAMCSTDLDQADVDYIRACMQLYRDHPWAFLCRGEELLRFMQSLEKQH